MKIINGRDKDDVAYDDKYGNRIAKVTTTSDSSTINITGLDINDDGGIYDIIITTETTAGASINFQYNGVSSGYDYVRFYCSDTRTTSGSITPTSNYGKELGNAQIGVGKENIPAFIAASIELCDQNVQYLSDSSSVGSGNQGIAKYGGRNINTASNITSLSVISAGGNMKSGTCVTIYKRGE